MRMKKVTALLLASAMCVGALAGCGNSSDTKETKAAGDTQAAGETKAADGTDAAKSEGSGDGEKVTIRLLTRMAGTTTQVNIYNDIINEFKEKHPEVTIVDDSQSDESAFNNILSTDIASGTMANIFRIQGVANLSDYIDNGMILNLQPYLD